MPANPSMPSPAIATSHHALGASAAVVDVPATGGRGVGVGEGEAAGVGVAAEIGRAHV